MIKYICIFILLGSSFSYSIEPVLPSEIEKPSTFIAAKNFSIALGLGIPYGILGPTLNYRIVDEAEVFVGKGTWGTSWGVRVYPIPQFKRARLSAFHGVNTITGSCSDDACDILDDGYAGWNVAAGIGPKLGQSGWEFDVIYILDQGDYQDDIDKAQEKGYDVKEEESSLQVSFGYRWSF